MHIDTAKLRHDAVDVLRSAVNELLSRLAIRLTEEQDDEFYDFKSIRADDEEGSVHGTFDLPWKRGVGFQFYFDWQWDGAKVTRFDIFCGRQVEVGTWDVKRGPSDRLTALPKDLSTGRINELRALLAR